MIVPIKKSARELSLRLHRAVVSSILLLPVLATAHEQGALPGAAQVALDAGSANANLLTVSGGNLYKPSVSVAQSQVGSNSADSNTWGSGSTATATGADIGSTWRTAAMVKVGCLLDAVWGDRFAEPGDLNRSLKVTLRLKQMAVGTAGSIVPRATLWGIDGDNVGWWSAADKSTQAAGAASSWANGVFDAATNEWKFEFTVNGLASGDRGDILSVVVAASGDSVVNESIKFSEAGSSIAIEDLGPATVPQGVAVVRAGGLEGSVPSADQHLQFQTVSGGNLYKSLIGSTTSALIGSNGSDNNTWGTGSTGAGTGGDLGSTWRMAAMVKIGSLLDTSQVDGFEVLDDLNQPLRLRWKLKAGANGPNNTPTYAPRAALWGVDTDGAEAGGWWGSADKATTGTGATTVWTEGVYDAVYGGWVFEMDCPQGIRSADGGDILALAVVGNQDAVAGEHISFLEAGSTLEITANDGTLDSTWPGDSDWDGIPDAWENAQGMNAADDGSINVGNGPDGDPDGDYITNYYEYIYGGNPQQIGSLAGVLLRERWTGVEGKSIEPFLKSSRFGDQADLIDFINSPETVGGLGNTVERIRGYIVAPETGEYHFRISGSDKMRFLLSSNESKFNRSLLIEPTVYSGLRQWDIDLSQRSIAVQLVAGERYYMEIWHKLYWANPQARSVSLAWQGPGTAGFELIPAAHIESYGGDANDADDDDLPDDWELVNGLDPALRGGNGEGYWGDKDGDGLTNHEEHVAGTRADLADTDGDGINDYDEVKTLETEALAGDVAPFQSVQTLAGSAYTACAGGWSKTGSLGHSTGVRGWVEYTISLPADGIYLLDLGMAPRIGGTLSDEYALTFAVNGQFVSRVEMTIAAGGSAHAKTLTPWLKAGTHTVRVFNDNALSFRRINIEQLDILSAQGADADTDGTPDWVQARITRLNGIDTPVTTSPVSPVCIEGRSRYPAMTDSGTQILHQAPGERWYGNIDLDATGQPVTFDISFENGALVQSRQLEWIATNLLEQSALTLRQGDALRLTAYEDPGNGAAVQGDVTLVLEGQTLTTTADVPRVYTFNNAGTHVIDVTYTFPGVGTVTHTVTVKVVAAPVLESPVCVQGHAREWDIASLPSGTILEMDERVQILDTTDLGNATTRHIIKGDAPESRHALVRLGEDGPVLSSVPIRGMSVRDAEDTSVQFTQDFGDGSYRVDMPIVVANAHHDVRVHYDIFVGGVIFDTGGVSKDFLASDFDVLGQATVTFIKTGTQGSACHRTSVWQGSKRIAHFY